MPFFDAGSELSYRAEERIKGGHARLALRRAG